MFSKSCFYSLAFTALIPSPGVLLYVPALPLESLLSKLAWDSQELPALSVPGAALAKMDGGRDGK